MIKLFVAASLLISNYAMAEEPEYAEAGSTSCPYVTRDAYDAIDRALPCVNFRLSNPEYQGERFLRESMRQGVYNELVQRNSLEANCKARAYHEKLANNAEMDAATEAIAARFVHYRQGFKQLRQASQREHELVAMTQGPRGEPGEGAARGATAIMQGMRDANRDAQRDQLIARIPYGFEPYVADAIRQLDEQLPDNFPEGATQAQINLFREKIRNSFIQTETAYAASDNHFRSLYRATDCVAPVSATAVRTIITPEELAGRSCPAGQTSSGGSYLQEDGTWRALSQSGAVTSLAREIREPSSPRMQYIFQNTLACNADPYAQRQANLSSFAIASGVLALVPGVGVIVVAGISAAVYADQIRHSCFGGQATGFRVTQGMACTQGLGLEGAVHSADTTDCGRDVLTAVGAVAFSGAFGTTRRILSGAEGILGGVESAAIRNADNIAAGAAERTTLDAAAGAGGAEVRAAADEAENAIVVTGRRRGGSGRRTGNGARSGERTAGRDAAEAADGPAGRTGARSTREAPAGGGRPRSSGSAGAETANARTAADDVVTSTERVPADTASRRLVDQSIDNQNIRLSEDQMRSLQEETFRRKNDIDRIIGGQGRNIHDEHTLLNEALDANQLERYIRDRGLSTADAQRLRESVEILQRERTVLTRARVNEDLAVLEREGAEVRTVPCDPVNGLNGTPAFHTSAKCSVVRFTEAVENYCSCGGRGSLGAWAGPCANALTDYLSGGQLADRDALPSASASGLRECKRIRIPAGTTVVHGGLRPTFSGHGGAAQIYLPTRGLAPRGTDASRLLESAPARAQLGISDDAIRNAQEIEVVAIAPISPSRELTAVYDAGRVCRQNPAGCSAAETERFANEFERFSRANPGQISAEERAQFQEWHDWIRGCRPIALTRGASSFGAFDPRRPGCGSRRTF